jgi:peroxiredoxin
MYPRERSLALEHRNDPFVMIGVNVGEDSEEIRRIAEQERFTWPIITDQGDGSSPGPGPLTYRWEVSVVPTTYVIDHEGIVRYKHVRENELERAIEQLVARARK